MKSETRKHAYWCEECQVPVLGKTCGRCNRITKQMCSSSLQPVFLEEIEFLRRRIGGIAEQLVELESWVSPSSSTYYVKGSPYFKIAGLSYTSDKISIKIAAKDQAKCMNRSKIDCLRVIKEANSLYIKELEYEAKSFIEDILNEYRKRTYFVSFSGGKDSTVLSHIVMRTLGRSNVLHIFSDTTIEFPDTYRYVNQFQCKHALTPFISCKSPLDFFDITRKIGPPSRILRWCCSTHKINPLSKIVSVLNPYEGVLAFEGVRRSESARRSHYDRISTDHKIGGEVLARPLLKWTDLEIWMYILYYELDVNAAYHKGFRRVGCLYCPFNSCWSEMMIKTYFPDEHSKWASILEKHAIQTNHISPASYRDHGWRVRAGGKGLEHYKAIIDSYPCALSDQAYNYQLTAGNIREIRAFLRPLGPQSTITEDDSSVSFIIKDAHNLKDIATVECSYADDSLRIRYLAKKDKLLLRKRVEKQIRKLQSCIQCGSCNSICPTGANKFGVDMVIDDLLCTSCLKCLKHNCPAVKALHYKGS